MHASIREVRSYRTLPKELPPWGQVFLCFFSFPLFNKDRSRWNSGHMNSWFTYAVTLCMSVNVLGSPSCPRPPHRGVTSLTTGSRPTCLNHTLSGPVPDNRLKPQPSCLSCPFHRNPHLVNLPTSSSHPRHGQCHRDPNRSTPPFTLPEASGRVS